MSKKSKTDDAELTQEEFAKLLEEIEQFDNKSIIYLARTDRFEIIPTTEESGKIVSKENLQFLKREVEKLGLKILYRIDKVNGETLLVNANTMRVMVLVEGMQ